MSKWARNYESCKECRKTEKRHMAKGLCVYCYLKQYHNNPDNRELVNAQKHKHYLEKQKQQLKQRREDRHFNGNREAVLARDGNKCVACHKAGNIVHHKDGNGRGNSQPNNDLTNLITLCRACHINEHREDVLKARFKKGITAWAKSYTACINCNTTKIEHNANGLCRNCYQRQIRKHKL